jgi:isocitrate lyase
VWQFITVAGFHIDSLATDLFARNYRERGMLVGWEGCVSLRRMPIGQPCIMNQ